MFIAIEKFFIIKFIIKQKDHVEGKVIYLKLLFSETLIPTVLKKVYHSSK